MDLLQEIQKEAGNHLSKVRYGTTVANGLAIFLLAVFAVMRVGEIYAPSRGDRRRLGYVRRFTEWLVPLWFLGVAWVGSRYTLSFGTKMFPWFGFLALMVVEFLLLGRTATTGNREEFLRRVLPHALLGILAIYRTRPLDDPLTLPLVGLAISPLLVLAVWPTQEDAGNDSIPYPEPHALLPSFLVATWMLAARNYAVPSFAAPIKKNLSSGAVLTVLVGVGCAFAQHSAAVASSFVRKGRLHRPLVPYAVVGFVLFVISGLASIGYSYAHAGLGRTLLWVPFLYLGALMTSVQIRSLPPSLRTLLQTDSLSEIPDTVEDLVERVRNANVMRIHLEFQSANRYVPRMARMAIDRLSIPWMRPLPTIDASERHVVHSAATQFSQSRGTLQVSPLQPFAFFEKAADANGFARLVNADAHTFVQQGPFTKLSADLRQMSLRSAANDGLSMTATYFSITFEEGSEFILEYPEMPLLSDGLLTAALLAHRLHQWKKQVDNDTTEQTSTSTTTITTTTTLRPHDSYAALLADTTLGVSKMTKVGVDSWDAWTVAPFHEDALEFLMEIFPWSETERWSLANHSMVSVGILQPPGTSPVLVELFKDPLRDLPPAMRRILVTCDSLLLTQLMRKLLGGLVSNSENKLPAISRHLLRAYQVLLFPARDPVVHAYELVRTLPWMERWLERYGWVHVSGDYIDTGVLAKFRPKNTPDFESVTSIRKLLGLDGADSPLSYDRGVVPKDDVDMFLSVALEENTLPALRRMAETVQELGFHARAMCGLLWIVTPDAPKEKYQMAPLQSAMEPGTGLPGLLRSYLWRFNPNAKRSSEDFPKITYDLLARKDGFWLTALTQTVVNLLWVGVVISALHMRLRRDPLHGAFLVELFGDNSGLSAYARYAYTAIFMALLAGFLRLYALTWTEIRAKGLFADPRLRWETLPYVVFFGASVLYLLPGVFHYLGEQKLQTMYFTTVFVAFLFFDFSRVAMPEKVLRLLQMYRDTQKALGLPIDVETIVTEQGNRFQRWWYKWFGSNTEWINAAACSLVLLLFVVLVGAGYFDGRQRWSLWSQVLVLGALLVTALFASPFYILFREWSMSRWRTEIEGTPGATSPSHNTGAGGTGDVFWAVRSVEVWQGALNKGILFSFIVLLLSVAITLRYLRVRLPETMSVAPSLRDSKIQLNQLLPN